MCYNYSVEKRRNIENPNLKKRKSWISREKTRNFKFRATVYFILQGAKMISYVIITALTATSIFFALLLYQSVRSRRALERELSFTPKPDFELLKAHALKEIEELKNLEQKQIEEEFREKRRQNDVEIATRQASIDRILEDYKISRSQAIAAEFEKQSLMLKNAFEEKQEEIIIKELELEQGLLNKTFEIEQLRKDQDSILESLRRKAMEDEQYCLHLSDADRLEVEDLQTVAHRYPRIRPIILKATYDIYYAPEVKKLVSRVVGPERISGIYRVTCKIDGRVYIGKSVDIGARWITHFKRAAGVETETTNLLYPAMRAIGLDKFSFEIVERDIQEDQLGIREKYWQNFYGAKDHGFSVR